MAAMPFPAGGLFRTISVRDMFRLRATTAWCFRDWAAHRALGVADCYVITLLPLGLMLPPDWCWFTSWQQAALAAVEIAKLKNGWHRVTQEDFTRALGDQIKAICQRHGARQGPTAWSVQADRSVTGRPITARLNGYAIPA